MSATAALVVMVRVIQIGVQVYALLPAAKEEIGQKGLLSGGARGESCLF